MQYQCIFILAMYFFQVESLKLERNGGFRSTLTRIPSVQRKMGKSEIKMSGDLIVDASYNLAAGTATLGLVCGVLENFKGPTGKVFGAGAIIFTLLGGFFAFQTSSLSFKFDQDSFSLVKNDGSSLGENVVVGGENKWRYKSFVNWAFLPSEDFPILVYFKETETPRDNWVVAPIVVDEIPGQSHFFPAISDVSQLKQNFVENQCVKVNSEEMK